MNKTTLRRFANSALVAALVATPAIALAPSASATQITVDGGGPVAAVTLPATIDGSIGFRTLPAPIDMLELEIGSADPQPVVVEDLDPALGIVAISADISGEVTSDEVSSVEEGADFTEYVYDENGRAIFKCADLHPSVAEPIPGDDVNCILNRSGLARPAALEVQPAVVPGLDTTLGIMPITITIDPANGRQVYDCDELDESVRIEIEGEEGKCYLDRSGLVREDDDVQPMTVPDLDPTLGIMPITIGIEPISGTTNDGLNAAGKAAIALTSLSVLASYLVSRKRHHA